MTEPVVPSPNLHPKPPFERVTHLSESPGALFEDPGGGSSKALFFVPDGPLPPRPPTRKRSDGKPPEHTAVYRLYAVGDELLYVGMSNAPLERFIEHRDDKDWWPQVETYSITWFLTRSEAEEAETAAIKDEWPMHNIAHQPRANGPFVMPSYLAELLVSELRAAVRATIEGASDKQIQHAEELFRVAFDPDILPNSEIWFMESDAPDQRACQNVDDVIKALGDFRPPIGNSMRDPQPCYQRHTHGPAAIGEAECSGPETNGALVEVIERAQDETA